MNVSFCPFFILSFYSILFYSTPPCVILPPYFSSIRFYYSVFCSILFISILSYSIYFRPVWLGLKKKKIYSILQNCIVWFCSFVFFSFVLHSIAFHSILLQNIRIQFNLQTISPSVHCHGNTQWSFQLWLIYTNISPCCASNVSYVILTC